MKIQTKTLAGLCLWLLAGSALAQADEPYPSRPLRFVIATGAGSTSELSARAVGKRLTESMGVSVVVEPRPGANGQIALQQVLAGKPDGYTFAIVSASSTTVPPAVMKSIPYDILKDFTPVATIANTFLLLTVASDSPFNAVADLVAAAKKAPGKYTYGDSTALYTLSMELFKQQAGVNVVNVKYKAPAQAAADMIGGNLTMMPDSIGAATANLKAGRTKPLAVFSAQRRAVLPNVPTMIELGYTDFEFNGWIGVLAPAGTPPAIVQRIAKELKDAVGSDEVRTQYAALSLEPSWLPPTDFAAMIQRETARYERIARDGRLEKQ